MRGGGQMTINLQGFWQSLARIPDVVKSIPDVLRQPAANPIQATILLGIVLAFAAIVLLTVGLVVTRPAPDQSDQAGPSEEKTENPSAPVLRLSSWLTVGSSIVLALSLVWIVAGLTTSNRDFCVSCHADSPHAAAPLSDPHKQISCVSCHETGDPVSRLTVNVIARIQHVAAGRLQPATATGYGVPAASDGCLDCHRAQIAGLRVDETRGLRVSHKEPLAAGANCVDCHVLRSGIIGPTSAGMAPCLRCHDGATAKAACPTCHVGDPAFAIRSTVPTESMAFRQVPDPQCGACHTDMVKCDACHGLRMPHSLQFKAYGHALPAANAIWNNNLKSACGKCHYAGHQSCQGPVCHTGSFPSHPSPDWKVVHQRASWSGASCACHEWRPSDNGGLNYCQICHSVKPPNAVP